MNEPVVILGAGLTGLSTAYHLNKDYHIFEKENEVGGLCRSYRVDGFTFDYTGHLLFLKNPLIKKLVVDLIGDNLIKHQRKSWVYLKNQLIKFPFQANFGSLPDSIAKECLGDFIFTYGYNQGKNYTNLLKWLENRFGKGLTGCFLRPYNQKMWKVPLSGITLDWVDKFIPQPDLNEVIDGVLDIGQKRYGYNTEFFYPKKGGIFSLPLAFKKGVKNLHLDEEVSEIFLGKKLIRFKSGNEVLFSRIVSTIPLPELLEIIKDIPVEIKSKAKDLQYTSVYNINLGVDKKCGPGVHWIYLPEKRYPFYRFGFGSKFSKFMAPEGRSSIYVEISYSPGKPFNKKGMLANTIEKLTELKVISNKIDINVVKILDIKYAYIIYNLARQRYLKSILDYLESQGIFSCGRYGAWEYSSMNDAIYCGMNIAKKINETM
ncbi:MAG: FAD-dependent oxidoreductase [bacterium]